MCRFAAVSTMPVNPHVWRLSVRRAVSTTRPRIRSSLIRLPPVHVVANVRYLAVSSHQTALGARRNADGHGTYDASTALAFALEATNSAGAAAKLTSSF
jgi:hypothetical protein